MRYIEVEIESRWRVNIRGPQSWVLCRQAGHRKPAWSHASRSWVVSEATAKDVVAMAEAAGLNVIVTGQMATVRPEACEAPAPPDDDEALLW
jgi:hypothetical protein